LERPRNITGEKGCPEKVDVEVLRSAKDDTAQACGDTGTRKEAIRLSDQDELALGAIRFYHATVI
jgi:hypothetical protein